MELLNPMISLSVRFLVTVKIFSRVSAPFCIPNSNMYDCKLFTPSRILLLICLFDYSIPRAYEVISSCGFYLPFLMANYENITMRLLVIFYSFLIIFFTFLWRNVYFSFVCFNRPIFICLIELQEFSTYT